MSRERSERIKGAPVALAPLAAHRGKTRFLPLSSRMSSPLTVAFLGTGIMGSGMARNAAKAGLEIVAWNRTRARAEPLTGSGIRVCDTADEAVREADVVVTMFSAGPAVEAVMLGDGGALAAMKPDAVWMQTSTVAVDDTARFADAARAQNIAFVDAPVLGTREPAEAGELVVVAAGDAAAVDRCEAVCDAIGKRTIRFETPGDATKLKLVVNHSVIGQVGLLAETVAFGRAIGVDPAAFFDAVSNGPIESPVLKGKGKKMLDGDFEPASFPLALAHKDVTLMLAAAGDDAELPVTRAVEALYAKAEDAGAGEADMAAVVKALL